MQEMSISELAELVRVDALLRSAFLREYSGPGDPGTALDLVANQTPLVPPGEYAELARLAFGRPDPDNADAQRQAVSELERLAAERSAVTAEVRRALLAVLDRPVEVSPPAERRRGNAFVVLAITLVVLIGVVARALVIPVPSLAIFDRSQTASEASLARELLSEYEFPEEVTDSVRLVGQVDDTTFLVLHVADPVIIGTTGDSVCLFEAFDGGERGYCDVVDAVRSNGISGFSSTTPSESFTFQWGPTGSLVINRR